MINRIRIRLGPAETDDEATLELKGSHEWILELWPFIAILVGGMVKAHEPDPETMAAVYSEMLAADEFTRQGKDFYGEFVTATIRAAIGETLRYEPHR